MVYDYSRLRGKIVEFCGSIRRFSAIMGISNKHLSNKINGHVQFSQKDIEKICMLLSIDRGDISEYFFAPEINQK